MNTQKNKQNNKGFIALTITFWCVLVLMTIVSLESEWISAYMYSTFYKQERARLQNAALQCLTIAHRLKISAVTDEEFIFWSEGDKCYGKTGDILEATTTSSHFWYATTTKF